MTQFYAGKPTSRPVSFIQRTLRIREHRGFWAGLLQVRSKKLYLP